MRDYITLDSSPYNEDCVQVTDKKPYLQEMTEECKRYKEFLQSLFPIPENIQHNTYFTIKSFPHDFGSYKEVCIIFDDNSEKSTDFAYYVENNLPSNWSTKKEEIAEYNKQEKKQYYCNLVFLQEHEAQEALFILDQFGIEGLYNYLVQWDNTNYDNITEESQGGKADTTALINNYLIGYNKNIPYVWIEKIIEE